MLALSVLVPSGLLIPTVPQMAPSLPTTTVITKGSFVPGVGKLATVKSLPVQQVSL